MAPYIVFTVLALGGLLLSDWRSWRAGVWICKPAASTGFIATAIAAGALDSGYGLTVLVALVLCWLGDVLLIPRDAPKVFLAGVGSFLLGHLGFAVAFGLRGVDATASLLAAVVALAPIVVVLRWLRPHVPPDMVLPVRAYTVVISLMVVLAVGATVAGGPATIAVGALLFYLSDLSVARDRFVAPGFVNGAWGLPLYYGGQLVLASTVAA